MNEWSSDLSMRPRHAWLQFVGRTWEMTDGSACPGSGSGSSFTYLSKPPRSPPGSVRRAVGKLLAWQRSPFTFLTKLGGWLQLLRLSGLARLFGPYLTEYSLVQLSTETDRTLNLFHQNEQQIWNRRSTCSSPPSTTTQACRAVDDVVVHLLSLLR